MGAPEDLSVVLSLKDQLSNEMGNPIKAIQGLTKGVDDVARMFKLASGIITGSITLMTRSALNMADQLDKMNRQTGVSVETLQKLSFVAAESGASLQEIGAGLRFLGRNLQAAREGSEEAIKSFAAMGIGLSELKDPQLTTEKLFYRISDAMANLSESERQGVFKLMGRGAQELIPLLSQGADAIMALGDAAKTTGAIMSKEAVAALDSFGDQIGGLKMAVKGMFGELIASQTISLPKILEGLEAFANAIVIAKEQFMLGWKSIVTFGASYAGMLKDILVALVETIKITMAKAVSAFATPIEIIARGLNELGVLPQKSLDSFLKALGEIDAYSQKSVGGPLSELPKQIGDRWNAASKEVLGYQKKADTAVAEASKDFADLRNKFQTAADLNTEQGRKAVVDKAAAGEDPVDKALTDAIRSSDKFFAELEAKKFKQDQEDQKRAEQIKKQVAEIVHSFEYDTGIKLTTEQIKELEQAAKEGHAEVHELLHEIQQRVEADPFSGLILALRDVSKELPNFRKAFDGLFQDMQSSFSNAFGAMITGGQKFNSIMKNLFADLKRSFIKMIADILAQNVIKQFAGIFASGLGALGIGGGGGASVPSTGVGGGIGSGESSGGMSLGGVAGLAGAGAAGIGASLYGSGTTFGISDSSIGLTGAAIGTAVGAQGISKGNVAQSAIGLGITGASIGMVAGPIGAGIGFVVGAAAGAILGNREKKKQEKEQEAQDAAAAEQQRLLDEQKKKAADLLKTQLQTTYGGGLATPEEAVALGEIMSGDVTPEDLDKLGINPQDVLARQQQIEGMQTTNNVNVGSPNINVSIGQVSSAYDIKNVADDLGYFLQQSIHDAAANG